MHLGCEKLLVDSRSYFYSFRRCDGQSMSSLLVRITARWSSVALLLSLQHLERIGVLSITSVANLISRS